MVKKTWNQAIKDLSDSRLRSAIKATVICGILAHGLMLFNKLSWHDDLNYNFLLLVKKAIGLGRWMRAFLGFIVASAFGGNNLTLPLFHGFFSLLAIAVSAYIITLIFDIKKDSLRVLLCGLMVSFPVVTSTFGYMFTAPYYFLALLLSVTAVYIASRGMRIGNFLLSALCICCSLGIYQAYFSIAVSLFVLLLIFNTVRDKYSGAPQLFRTGLFYLSACAVGLAAYFIVWTLCMKVLGLTASNYQGISGIASSGVSAYLKAVIKTYKRFFMIFDRADENMYPMGIAVVQWVVIVISALNGIFIAIRHFKKNRAEGVLLILLMAILPLCFNIIYVMTASSPDAKVHSLMLYGQSMLYVFLICSMDFIHFDASRFLAIYYRASAVVLALLIVMNVYFSNSCYVKAKMIQEQNLSNMTVLVTRIKSLDGYDDKLPVCFILSSQKDATYVPNKAFSDINILPYNNLYLYPQYRSRNLLNFLNHWCGFTPKTVSSKHFKKLDEVKQMPNYPDAGSIRIIENTVVVKW